ncbi:hypothetical protein GRJ2_002018300 [Grus japonensis]|uniref:Uncharacterized protein n=1 Tax=Grus japonensis TaxID=30415 RepID=A0ABC9XCX4_GRUJA
MKPVGPSPASPPFLSPLRHVPLGACLCRSSSSAGKLEHSCGGARYNPLRSCRQAQGILDEINLFPDYFKWKDVRSSSSS